ncbi:MotA/TolQ/ExbB proton channel family protein [Pseudoteredinibacter isoporae]|uniref:MotA/TolQ/ExbB proton channel family protein n=1 Tax=Pseudoteredinibacter isoporae TaxID=570281 RepID=UPI0031024FA8
MIFHLDQWVFWAILLVGLLAYSLLFDSLLSVEPEIEKQLSRCQLSDACLAALPLLGLLGTIIGLLHTFADMATEHVDFNTLIAGGVGTALGTTQLGLLLAVPGYLLNHYIKSRLSHTNERSNCTSEA